MILVTGGAWQGKREYAYGLMTGGTEKKLIIDGATCTAEDMKWVQIVDQLHLWIRRQMEEIMPEQTAGFGIGSGADDEMTFDQQEMLLCKEKIDQALQDVLDINPNVIFIVNELGCGVIPMEVFDRRYRELVGRVSCDLAKEAKEVHRVVCGVGEVLKCESSGSASLETQDSEESDESVQLDSASDESLVSQDSASEDASGQEATDE